MITAFHKRKIKTLKGKEKTFNFKIGVLLISVVLKDKQNLKIYKTNQLISAVVPSTIFKQCLMIQPTCKNSTNIYIMSK
jgi:hypothetical protein